MKQLHILELKEKRWPKELFLWEKVLSACCNCVARCILDRLRFGWMKDRIDSSTDNLLSNTFNFWWASASASALVEIKTRPTLHCPIVDNYAEIFLSNTFLIGWFELRYFPVGWVGWWVAGLIETKTEPSSSWNFNWSWGWGWQKSRGRGKEEN